VLPFWTLTPCLSIAVARCSPYNTGEEATVKSEVVRLAKSMEHSISRILIETTVRKALRDIHSDPHRSIRNLVDMAAYAAKGRFQKNFFRVTQNMLENENSPYYGLMEHIVHNVEHEYLLKFGINLGYNSCTKGAKKIREIEKEQGFDVPWALSVLLPSEQAQINYESYHSLIFQGEKLGIHTWLLFARDQVQEALQLMYDHTDSAFFLFVRPEQITRSLMEQMAEAKNVMPVLRCCDGVQEACEQLRARELPYSVYDIYTDQDVESLTSGRWLSEVVEYHPTFSGLLAARDCSRTAREQVHAYMEAARREQLFETLPIEISTDCCYIDGIISEQGYAAGFDEQGQLFTIEGHTTEQSCNIFANSLYDVLKTAFPKKTAKA